ncbi:MAG: EcsC family protein [Cyanobacteria bacterium P01_A01_bin.17]
MTQSPPQMAQETYQQLEAMATELSQNMGQLFEGATQEVGQSVDAVAQNPLLKWVARLPGASKLLTFLGQADTVQIEAEVADLQRQHPSDSRRQIAERLIQQSALQAGAVGLLTNLAPPLALALFAVDLAAMTKLQAEMVYRIAAAYGFPLSDSTRRGEILAIFGLSVLGSGVLKTGASFVEVFPVVGAISGAAVNATLLFGLGQTACQFYESKPSPTEVVVTAEPV